MSSIFKLFLKFQFVDKPRMYTESEPILTPLDIKLDRLIKKFKGEGYCWIRTQMFEHVCTVCGRHFWTERKDDPRDRTCRKFRCYKELHHGTPQAIQEQAGR